MLDLAYSLEPECPVPWSISQEKNLHSDYPLAVDDDEKPQDFVIRRYLETVWLPESISSISHFISSLRRVQHDLSLASSTVHPLHAYLDPLILTVKMCSEKYRTELPQILADGGGAGEQEEAMMWFAWNYGKEPEDVDTGFTLSQRDKDKDKSKEEIWKAVWLEKLERRETMIQILLYLLKLTLPGPCPQPSFAPTPESSQFTTQNPLPYPSPSKKLKRPRVQKGPSPTELLEEQLELYMDKLATWQLMDSINPQHARNLGFRDMAIPVDPNGKGKGRGGEERHWTVGFCEDVVDVFFKDSLPSLCALLRSKIVQDPDTEVSSDNSRAPSPTSLRRSNSQLRAKSLKRTDSLASSSTSSQPSNLRRSISRAPSNSNSVSANGIGNINGKDSRSRSLSVSLAEDEDRLRRATVGPRRMLSREVSMSKTFREKVKRKREDPQPLQKKPKPTSILPPRPKMSLGRTIIEETPVRPSRASHSNFARPSISAPEILTGASRRIARPLFIPDSDDERDGDRNGNGVNGYGRDDVDDELDGIVVEDTPERRRKARDLEKDAREGMLARRAGSEELVEEQMEVPMEPISSLSVLMEEVEEQSQDRVERHADTQDQTDTQAYNQNISTGRIQTQSQIQTRRNSTVSLGSRSFSSLEWDDFDEDENEDDDVFTDSFGSPGMLSLGDDGDGDGDGDF